jgi:MerR family transcriptional regulator/heat shock protein HspR
VSSPLLSFDDECAPFYTVGQVAAMLNVKPAFLRRLDAEGLIQPARSDGRQRRYTQLEIRDVERIIGLTGEGMTLAGVRRIILLENQVRELQQKLADK